MKLVKLLMTGVIGLSMLTGCAAQASPKPEDAMIVNINDFLEEYNKKPPVSFTATGEAVVSYNMILDENSDSVMNLGSADVSFNIDYCDHHTHGSVNVSGVRDMMGDDAHEGGYGFYCDKDLNCYVNKNNTWIDEQDSSVISLHNILAQTPEIINDNADVCSFEVYDNAYVVRIPAKNIFPVIADAAFNCFNNTPIQNFETYSVKSKDKLVTYAFDINNFNLQSIDFEAIEYNTATKHDISGLNINFDMQIRVNDSGKINIQDVIKPDDIKAIKPTEDADIICD